MNLWRIFWKWATLFCYRRWANPQGQPPVGLPFHRDPDHKCTFYEPRPRELGDFKECMTDGHYLCRGCCHRKPDDEEAGS